MASVYIGTSGYVYDHWRRIFYPEDLASDHWLEFFCECFSTVEINNSFYRLPERSTFLEWKKRSPDDFLFSVKVSRYITHMKKLKDPEEPVKKFLHHAGGLGRKLGPLLFQLPPNWKPNPNRLDHLLSLRSQRSRWVLEFRNDSWFRDDVLEILRRRGAGFCIHDLSAECPLAVTGDFAYVRFHGTESHTGKYTRRALSKWAVRMNKWLGAGLDVFAYFNNDVDGHAIVNARELRELIRGKDNR